MSGLNTVVQKEATPVWRSLLLRILLSLFLAFAGTWIAVAVFAAVVYWGGVDDKWVVPVATVCALLSLFFGARLTGKGAHGHGFVLGAAVGVCYWVLLYAFSMIWIRDFDFSVRTAIFMLIGTMAGGIGGVAGQTVPEKRDKHRRKKKKK